MIKMKKWMMNPCEECTHILSDETGEAVIVDCGAYYPNERRHLLEYIEKERLRPVRLLLTHAHHDHVYGNDLIHEHFGLLSEVHEADKELMTVQLRLIHTPGHTPGSVFFYCETEGIAFSGDTLFYKGIGRSDLPGGNKEELTASLKFITEFLPDETVIYPGHGKKSTIGYEKA